MKKLTPYIIAAIVVIALGSLLILAAKRQPRKLNERVTLRQSDKIPYGTYVAQQLLPGLFPNAIISTDKQAPGYWNALSEDSANQAILLMAKSFNADKTELEQLVSFAKNGNYVFIIAKNLSLEADRFFHCMDNNMSFDGYYGIDDDSLQVRLEAPPFSYADENNYIYPGRKYESFFSTIDTAKTIVLGRTEKRKVNFIQLNTGKGSIFIHLAPLAFSNYFILHKKNVQYFQKAVSVIPQSVNKVVWSEYYLTKPLSNRQPSLFRVLFQYPSFKWAFLTAIVLLLLYVLLEMRRKQRLIPVYEKPVNESLDFVKTIGRLYYDKHDHQNLAKKMGTYFLDHVRTTYKLSTQLLDDTFITALQAKSGYPIEDIKSIILFIKNIDTEIITDAHLFNFHKQLELFYLNTQDGRTTL